MSDQNNTPTPDELTAEQKLEAKLSKMADGVSALTDNVSALAQTVEKSQAAGTTPEMNEPVKKTNETDPLTKEAMVELEDRLGLEKSFQTGTGYTPDSQTGAAALRYEYLEDQLHMLTSNLDDFTIFPDIPKKQVTSTVVKYAQYFDHGKVGHSRFVNETGISDINSPTLIQELVTLKFLSDTKNRSLATMLVNNLADPMQVLEESAANVVGKTIEWAIFNGDANLSADPRPDTGLEFNGIHKLVDQKTNVMDLRGDVLSEQVMNEAAVIVAKGYGKPTHAYMPIGVLGEFVNTYILPRQWVQNTNQPANITTGVATNQFQSFRGPIELKGSTIMENEHILDEDLSPEQNAPLPPRSVTAEVNPNDRGDFREEDMVGPIEYRVTVNSDKHSSAPSEVETATVASENASVALNIEVQQLQGGKPVYVSIYRKSKIPGAEFYYLVDRVSASEIGQDGRLTFIDRNQKIPGTVDVFLGELSARTIGLLELLPLLKINMAQVNASLTFTVLWYGALALYAPKRWVHMKNVAYTAKMPQEKSFR